MLGVVIFSAVSGIVISWKGYYMPFIISGFAIMTVGVGLTSLLDTSPSNAEQIGYLIPIGVGVGLVLQTLVLAVQASVQPREIASATATVTFFRTIGGVVGTAIYGAALTNVMNTDISNGLANAGIPATSDASSFGFGSTDISALPEPVRSIVEGAFVHGIQTIFLTAIAFGSIGFLSSLFMQQKTLSKHINAAQLDTRRVGGSGDQVTNPSMIAMH
jgi:hypothetical protein